MIEQQIRPWDVLDTTVLDLFHSVPREAFVDDKDQALAFADIELPIGHGQAMMSPKVEARILQSLKISRNTNILEIGTGSGFFTACLAKLGNHVTSYEYYEDLSNQARERLNALNITNVNCLVGDIFNKLNSLTQYDVIVLTGSIPQDAELFTKHLNLNGRLFCVLGESPVMTAKLFTCVAKNSYREESLFETELAPLLSTSKEQEFSF
jgi:protein-L-isoaspartate(D-aspartate) O-methyltransferase